MSEGILESHWKWPCRGIPTLDNEGHHTVRSDLGWKNSSTNRRPSTPWGQQTFNWATPAGTVTLTEVDPQISCASPLGELYPTPRIGLGADQDPTTPLQFLPQSLARYSCQGGGWPSRRPDESRFPERSRCSGVMLWSALLSQSTLRSATRKAASLSLAAFERPFKQGGTRLD